MAAITDNQTNVNQLPLVTTATAPMSHLETSHPQLKPSSAAVGSAAPTAHRGRKWFRWVAALLAVIVVAYLTMAQIQTALNTVSTDDAYVNSHFTFVAPRVAGQVSRVLVDENFRVKKGDILVQIDREPYQVQIDIKQAALTAAEADLVATQALVRGQAGQLRGARFALQHSIEQVRNQLAVLRSNVAQLKVEQATLFQAEKDYARSKPLADMGTIAPQEFDAYKAKLDVARNRVSSAEEVIQQTRVSLGLPIDHVEPLKVPDDLDQNFSLVRQALNTMAQLAAPLGFTPTSWNMSPKDTIAEFLKQDPEGNLDNIYNNLIPHAPAIKQSEAKLLQVRRDLELAKLNLRYCDVVSEIDGVVTRRNINPGNNVQIGQSLMAVRSLTEIWIDANFKETQLANLRIGQRVRCDVDMYGGRHEFEGRITGFTMGTGQTLALLPPQNATGNYVKIVQRLPVRIELVDYDPEQLPLFTGLSVTPYVYFKEAPTGPNAGKFLQPRTPLPQGTVVSADGPAIAPSEHHTVIGTQEGRKP